jgi:diadenosine tetraphosphate (Ap4A) HIT family hydrolase
MQNGSHASSDAPENITDCAFCQRNMIAANILQETAHFLIVADYAPLVEGHLLIIPRHHYACYGEVPAELDAELFAIKREIQQFFKEFYVPAIFWEHGIFRQTVFHAHLHCFPFGTAKYSPEESMHSFVVHAQDDIRDWYVMHGQYFYMEDARIALLFAPEMDTYLHIIRDVLWRGASMYGLAKKWRSSQQRQDEGFPLIAATLEKWQQFQQQQGVDYANESPAR